MKVGSHEFEVSTERYQDGWRSVAFLPGGKQRSSGTCDSREGAEMDLYRQLKDEFAPAPKFDPSRQYESAIAVLEVETQRPRYPTEKQRAVASKHGQLHYVLSRNTGIKKWKRSEKMGDRYLDWIFRELARPEHYDYYDFDYLLNWAEWFDRNKNKLRQAGMSLNIYDYHGETIGKTMQSLVNYKGEPLEKKKRDYTVLANSGGWRVCVPWSHGAAVYLGQEVGKVKVKWCVAANSHDGKDNFERYTDNGALVFFIRPDAKYAIHFHIRGEEAGSYNLFNARDASLVDVPSDLPKELVQVAISYATREAKRRGQPIEQWVLLHTEAAHQNEPNPEDDDFDIDSVAQPDPAERHLPPGQTVNFDDIPDHYLFRDEDEPGNEYWEEAEDPKSAFRSAIDDQVVGYVLTWRDTAHQQHVSRLQAASPEDAVETLHFGYANVLDIEDIQPMTQAQYLAHYGDLPISVKHRMMGEARRVIEAETPKDFIAHKAPRDFTVQSGMQFWTVDKEGNITDSRSVPGTGYDDLRMIAHFDVQDYIRRKGRLPTGTIQLKDIAYWTCYSGQHVAAGTKVNYPAGHNRRFDNERPANNR